MIETQKGPGVAPGSVSHAPENSALTHAKEAWKGMRDLAGAEVEILSMKATRVGALAFIGGVLGLIMLGFGIYGLVLLNTTLDIALRGPETPAWVSPLVRGVLYVAGPAVALFLVWHSCIGYGKAAREEQAEPLKRREEAQRGSRV